MASSIACGAAHPRPRPTRARRPTGPQPHPSDPSTGRWPTAPGNRHDDGCLESDTSLRGAGELWAIASGNHATLPIRLNLAASRSQSGLPTLTPPLLPTQTPEEPES
jgi:hypothetical protein